MKANARLRVPDTVARSRLMAAHFSPSPGGEGRGEGGHFGSPHFHEPPNFEAHRLGGYKTWTGLHSYAEPGTGEPVVEEVMKMLNELAQTKSRQSQAANKIDTDERG